MTSITRVAPAQRGDVRLVSLSPDGRFLAYGLVRGFEADVVIASVEGPASARVVVTWPYPPRRLLWSPNGRRLAFLIGGPAAQAGGDRVGWCRLGDDGAEAATHRPGHALAWLDDERLLVADARAGELCFLDPEGEAEERLPLAHDGQPGFPPRLAVHDGVRVGFSTRSAEEMVAALWTRDAGEEPRLVSEMPTAKVVISPFFSSGGVLATHLVHAAGSAIIVFDDPEGRLVYDSPLRDPPEAPVWTPAGIVWFRRTDPDSSSHGAAELSALDPASGEIRPLTSPGVVGRPWLAPGGELRIDATGAALCLAATDATAQQPGISA